MNLEKIKSALQTLSTGDFLEKSKNLLATIGYRSERTLELTGTIQDFFDEFPIFNAFADIANYLTQVATYKL